MCLVIILPCDDNLNIMYLLYDFEQIKNTILVTMYVQELNNWQKVFINYDDGQLNTGMLQQFINNDAEYEKVCNNLTDIFLRKENQNAQLITCMQNLTQDHAFALLGMCN